MIFRLVFELVLNDYDSKDNICHMFALKSPIQVHLITLIVELLNLLYRHFVVLELEDFVLPVDDAALLVDLMEKTMEMVIENLGAVEVVDTVMVGLDMLMEVDLMDDDLVDKVAHKNILKIYLI